MCFNTWQNEWCARSSVSPHGHMAGGKFRNAHQHGKPGNPHQQSTIIMNWITFFSPCKVDMIDVFLSFSGHDWSRTGEEKLWISLFFALSRLFNSCAIPRSVWHGCASHCLPAEETPLFLLQSVVSTLQGGEQSNTINSNLRWIRNEVDCTGAASWQQVTESVRSGLGPGRQSGAASRQLKSAAPPPSLLLLMCLRLSRGGRRQCCCCCDVDFHSTPPLVREASPNHTTLP